MQMQHVYLDIGDNGGLRRAIASLKLYGVERRLPQSYYGCQV